MGFIRKVSSFCTFGAIDLRSDKERIARSTKDTAEAIKAQTKVMEQQLKLEKERKN